MCAASVYPEPGSNSHVQFSVQFCANAFLSVCVSCLKDFTVFIGCSFYYAKNFTRLTTFVIRLFKKSSGLVILFNYQSSLWFFLCRLSDSSSNISQSLAFVKHFFNFFQFIVFNGFELFLLLLQFSLLFLNCFCCVCVVFSDVDYNTTLQRVCQQVFSFFCSLKTAKK